MYDLKSIEMKNNIEFPKEYKHLYQSNFKGINIAMGIHVGNDVFYIRKFLTAFEINDILEAEYDFFGYDIIPIAEMEYEDYICLYYGENMQTPSIIYWSYELALENSEEAVLFLYDSMHEFITNLK